MSVKNKVFFPKNINDAFRSSPALFSIDIADSVKEDYLSLLSVGIDDEEAEQRLFSHYKNTLQRGDIDEADVTSNHPRVVPVTTVIYREWSNYIKLNE